MAACIVVPRLAAPKNLCSSLPRYLSFSPPQPAPIEKPPTIPASASAIIDLNDAAKLFSSLTTSNLLRSSINLEVAAIEPVVDLGTWVMKSRLMDAAVVRCAVLGTVKHTFFEHFCAGEDADQAVETVRKVNEAGLRGMLDYAPEDAVNNEACDRNLEGFLRTVESMRSLPPSSTSFMIVKITAICPINLLKRVSDLLRWQQRDPSFHLPWKLDTLPIFVESSPLYHTPEKPEPLTQQEEHDLQLGHERLLKLSQRCQEANVPLAIDAEYTSVQPAIDYITYSSAIQYNRNGEPIVYGTMQAYLKDAGERLVSATQAAEKMGVSMGYKLVRGAYMSSETALAHSLGHESPIHNNIQDTHGCYNDCASFMLEQIARGSGSVIIATHNVESGKLAAAKAWELGIGNGNQKLEFAQLYGMADALSFGLRNAGFQVSKYMPFGCVDMVMPYLLRRAEENRGMLSSSTLDRQLMRKELWRRLKATVGF